MDERGQTVRSGMSSIMSDVKGWWRGGKPGRWGLGQRHRGHPADLPC